MAARIIPLDEAVREIRQAYVDPPPPVSQPWPFFFVVGAGVSYPSVPLASEIVTELEKGIPEDRPDPSLNPQQRYSEAFDKRYPQRVHQQEYLRRLIEGKAISLANLRLAQLLLNGKLSNLVVTPNFDDFLQRALQLFGEPHDVFNDPKDAGRLDTSRGVLQVLHVHGTYRFYDCRNLTRDIEQGAVDPEDGYTVASFLKGILHQRSPLVVGYGGWENDVIMQTLRVRIKRGPLPQRVYWFCYQQSEIERLPQWLTNSADVSFVVPHESRWGQPGKGPPDIAPREDAVAPTLATTANAEEPRNTHGFISPVETKPAVYDGRRDRLDAVQVLDALAQAFDHELPQLLRDPLAHFAQQLRESLPHVEADGRDHYSFSALIAKVERARDLLQSEEAEAQLASKLEITIDAVRDAVRASHYVQALQLARQHTDTLAQAPPERTTELLSLVWTAASSLRDNSDAEREGYDLVVSIGKVMEGRGLEDEQVHEMISQALLNKGISLGESQRSDDALGAFQELIERCDKSQHPASSELVADAWFNLGIARDHLASIAPPNEKPALLRSAFDAFGEVVRRFAGASEQPVRKILALSLFNQGVASGELGDPDEAIRTYTRIVKSFEDDTDEDLRGVVVRALFNWAATLGKLNRPAQEAEKYAQLIDWFGDATGAIFRDLTAQALFNKAGALRFLDSNKTLQTFDELLARFGSSPELELRQQVAHALINKSVLLATLDRHAESRDTADEALKLFERDVPGFADVVARALRLKSRALQKLREYEQASALRNDLVRRFATSDDPVVRGHVASTLSENMIELWTAGQHGDAIQASNLILEHFRDDKAGAIRAVVVHALFLNASCLDKRGEKKGMLRTFRDIAARHRDVQDPSARLLVGLAMNGIGFDLLCNAKRLWGAEGEQAGRTELARAHEQLTEARIYFPESPEILGNLGYTIFLLGQADAATILLAEAIRLGGKGIQEAELADAEIHPLPQDEAFKALVLSIPLPAESPDDAAASAFYC